MLTDQQLAEIAALANAATPGPWHVLPPRAQSIDRCYHVRSEDRHFETGCIDFDGRGKATAAYIAAVSPDVVCALLAEVQELRAQRAALAGVLAAVETPAHNAAVLRSGVNMLDYTHGMESLDPAPAVEAR